MKTYACSDLHVSPTHFSDRARAFLEEAAQQADLTLLCGDIFEGSWHPLQTSVKSPNGQELLKLIQAQRDAVILLGNHDWILEKYLVDFKYPVQKNHRFEMDGKSYYAAHGWVEYDLPLSWLAPIYKWLLPLFPILTRWWTRRKSPRTLKHLAQESKERSGSYWRHVRRVSTRAIIHAINEDCIPIWGHTHHRHMDAYESWLAINCGDFAEDDIGGIVIEDGVAREW